MSLHGLPEVGPVCCRGAGSRPTASSGRSPPPVHNIITLQCTLDGLNCKQQFTVLLCAVLKVLLYCNVMDVMVFSSNELNTNLNTLHVLHCNVVYDNVLYFTVLFCMTLNICSIAPY